MPARIFPSGESTMTAGLPSSAAAATMRPSVVTVMPSIPRPAPKSWMTRAFATLPVGTSIRRDQRPALGAVVGDVERFFIGREGKAVGLERRGQERDDVALEADQEDSLEIELARLGADVARVGDVHAALAIDGDVVGAVEPLVVVVVGERANRAVAVGDRDAAAAAGVGPLGDDQAAASVEDHAVGAAARLAEDGGSTGFAGRTA